jgi:hypothetical protein
MMSGGDVTTKEKAKWLCMGIFLGFTSLAYDRDNNPRQDLWNGFMAFEDYIGDDILEALDEDGELQFVYDEMVGLMDIPNRIMSNYAEAMLATHQLIAEALTGQRLLPLLPN